MAKKHDGTIDADGNLPPHGPIGEGVDPLAAGKTTYGEDIKGNSADFGDNPPEAPVDKDADAAPAAEDAPVNDEPAETPAEESAEPADEAAAEPEASER